MNADSRYKGFLDFVVEIFIRRYKHGIPYQVSFEEKKKANQSRILPSVTHSCPRNKTELPQFDGHSDNIQVVHIAVEFFCSAAWRRADQQLGGG